MPQIVLTVSSLENINFRLSKTVKVDDEEWKGLTDQEKIDYGHDLAKEYLDEVVEIGWKVQ